MNDEMIVPRRMNAKLFVSDETAVSLPAIVPVFHRWIQTQAAPGLLIDVADYKHVPDGPGVLIIGHEGDYALDQANGRSSLLYSRKREWPGADFQSRLRLVIGLALQGAQLLANDPALNLTFDVSQLELTFPDRLHAPNTPETLAALQADITAVLAAIYGPSEISLTRTTVDGRRPFSLQAAITHRRTLAELAAIQPEPEIGPILNR